MPTKATAAPAQRPVIVWFRDDLRLHDNAALSAAAQTGQPLVLLYVFDDSGKDTRPLGGAAKWWLAQSLRALAAALAPHGQSLILRRGRADEVLPRIAAETNATAVHWNRPVDPAAGKTDARVIAALRALGIGGSTHAANLLAEPGVVAAKDGGPVRVFTPFWRRMRQLGPARAPRPAPTHFAPGPALASEPLESLRLEPHAPDWADGLRDAWQPGEAGARERLATFLDTAANYATNRDRPDLPATSRLSPHLRFGEISASEIYAAAQFAADERRAPSPDIEKFLSELGWREFSYQLLRFQPEIATVNLQRRFDAFPWHNDDKALRAWQTARTGYPIVDAGMRELWTTGWMHNRVRMIVASFLVKHLLIDWRAGEQWFWDTLVDADPANNPASWQWVAGCGADAAPYFRIFNPVLQGQRFDPDGAYVRRHVPELARLPDRAIHAPWLAAPLDLADAAIVLGRDYPEPMVDHAKARQRALDALASIKTASPGD